MRRAQLTGICIAIVSILLVNHSTYGVVEWNETTNGELSSNGNAPTNLGTWGPGTHSIVATSGSADIDDFRFAIPAGATLQSIINSAYAGVDETAFVSITAGTTINHAAAPTGLLGYAHFGPAQGNTGIDLMPVMSPAVPPQGPGNYSIWWQQAGSPATVTLDFVVTPEPASGIAVAMLALTVATPRRRRR